MKRRRRPHSPECRHCPRVRLLGLDYQTWRASWDEAEEATTYGYATEREEYREAKPGPTFRDYLIAMIGSGWPMSGTAPTQTRALTGPSFFDTNGSQ